MVDTSLHLEALVQHTALLPRALGGQMQGTVDDRKEAVKTYVEQTKLLVALASAFIVAPAVLIPLSKDAKLLFGGKPVHAFLWAEGGFILSVLSGYVVLATIAGSQHKGEYDVYRPATMTSSWVQLISYLGGLLLFSSLLRQALS